ncbi:MAG: outer membrane beta-barrel protein [Paludibacteraceae bacterium]|nr:outer membrane beta-barrel protein [Paludibacteraceae bacterium]
MAKSILFHITFAVGLMWMLLAPASVLADNAVYRYEVGAQAGAAYYMGELAPHPFMSTSETFGLQLRAKIDSRWALQAKGQRQRVINTIDPNNEWKINSGRYQTSMWHFDIVGEFNFFQYGYNSNDFRVRNYTPYIFLGIGATAFNEKASNLDGYNLLGWHRTGKDGTGDWEYDEPDFALYIPVGIGFKWRFAPRWQLQAAWQHNLYMVKGDGLEGGFKKDPKDEPFNNQHNMNGSNVFNNDVTSTMTVGVVFEFMREKGVCVLCR